MINFDAIKEQIGREEIIAIIEKICGPIDYLETDTALILPTVCHNVDAQEASQKLYYYDNTKLFFCYTHCNESFDIFELIGKMLDLRGLDSSLPRVLEIMESFASFSVEEEDFTKHHSLIDRYAKKNQHAHHNFYSEKVLDFYSEIYPIEWIKDGLKLESMKKYGIKFSLANNQAIIPHYDIEKRLFGVRVRNFDELEVLKGGKYMPAKVENKYLTHPLMYNLYGIDINKDAIKTFKTAWIAEGEKSVMIADGWYGENNLMVASCGNKINKFQLNILLSLGVKDIVICYDSMSQTLAEDEIYFKKLYEMCQKYKQYANFSFIFDRKHLLPYKAAPVDCGREVFESLMRERVYV